MLPCNRRHLETGDKCLSSPQREDMLLDEQERLFGTLKLGPWSLQLSSAGKSLQAITAPRKCSISRLGCFAMGLEEMTRSGMLQRGGLMLLQHPIFRVVPGQDQVITSAAACTGNDLDSLPRRVKRVPLPEGSLGSLVRMAASHQAPGSLPSLLSPLDPDEKGTSMAVRGCRIRSKTIN